MTSSSLPSLPETLKQKKKLRPQAKILFYVGQTKYSVVMYVGRKMLDYKLTENVQDPWDLMWTDSQVTPDQFDQMKLYQKVNHFPGMYSLARKNHLGRHLMQMRAKFPHFYRFFPKTYLLPADYSDFKSNFLNKKKTKTFIVKPEASCQGRGIYLTRTSENVDPMDHVVIQNYIDKPFLIDGLKFDFRIYVLLTGCDPLRIYLYNEGLARFATEEYKPPKNLNLDNLCMHLTNYAINKKNKNFVFNKDQAEASEGHKRSLSSVYASLKEQGHNVDLLMSTIEKIIVKMFCSVQPILAHNYSSCQPQSYKNDMCFELLGLDVLLDDKLTPYLIEVNHTPSFNTDTPLDKLIKRNVIRDSIVLMDINKSHKLKHLKEQKIEFEKRAMNGGKTKLLPEEREKIVRKAREKRDLYEIEHLGGFKKLFPLENEEEPYQEFIDYAKILWEKATGTFKKQVSLKANETLLKPFEEKDTKFTVKKVFEEKKESKIVKIPAMKTRNSLPIKGFNALKRSQSQNSTKASLGSLLKPKELFLKSKLKKEPSIKQIMIKENDGKFIKGKIVEFGISHVLKTKEEYQNSCLKYYNNGQ